jgi:hypothetical protein
VTTANGFQEKKISWPTHFLAPTMKSKQTLFTFELTEEAAHRNLCILKRFNQNLQDAIDAQPDSPVSYGSEFRPVTLLQPLFEFHPNWTRFRHLLLNGSQWPLLPITEDSRQQDLSEAIEFGNHKGASNNTPLLIDLIKEDVTQGFILPILYQKYHPSREC